MDEDEHEALSPVQNTFSAPGATLSGRAEQNNL